MRVLDFVRKESESHTIYLDNLPRNVLKGEIFREFRRFGFVKDMYVSRKNRRNRNDSFAFIRFHDFTEALRAVEGMNGKIWYGRELLATISKYRRTNGNKGDRRFGGRKKKRSLKWVATRRRFGEMKSSFVENKAAEAEIQRLQRKVVIAEPSKEMCKLLERSLMGVNVNPMIFEDVQRRVWIEVMGLPVFTWSEDTFKNIAKLWGTYVYADDRLGELMSFTVARFLIDSYVWEQINEWIKIKVEDREFEVFVKEFGAEVFSRESHPNELEKRMMNDQESENCSGSWVKETQGNAAVNTPAMEGPEYSKSSDGNGDTLIEKVPVEVNAVNVGADEGVVVTMHGEPGENMEREVERVGGFGNGSDSDHPEPTKGKIDTVVNEGVGIGPLGSGPISSNADSCLFPPGFGPGSNQGHVHRPEPTILDVDVRKSPSLPAVTDRTVRELGQMANLGEKSDTMEAIKMRELCEIGGL
ncbi:Serine arginine-rich splicing factor 2 [Stylosanthes scabra]|uniref:Serine arginine-rich splicing factor 2 n=1 Tax=Stylosanthes scabra TaxID=79078 RepID=A0ABU6X8Q7_9FABA|nr:Serine arginine-rich splicing factor 2 [Stylosanthes scabra]